MRRINMDYLRNLATQRIPISADEDGYFGRECPLKECLGYFKITRGTRIKEPLPVIVRIADIVGTAEPSLRRTNIQSVALQKVTDALHEDLKSVEFEHKPQGYLGLASA
jgi:hypothetical protein